MSRAEFRLPPPSSNPEKRGQTERIVSPLFCLRTTDEGVFVRAQAILDAQEKAPLRMLTAADRKTLSTVMSRARRAARNHPNFGVEVSPYIAALLRLEVN